ncbi:MAG: hypothetical protein JWO42_631 [Chloroflexi bacterium]|nr:hypothetical protein [Chloroflexota bacterium]
MNIATDPIRREILIDRFIANRPAPMRHAVASLAAGLEYQLRTVTLHQFEALVYLNPDGLLTRDFARAMDITEGSTSVVALRLGRHGLADRRADYLDPGMIRLVPTDLAHMLFGRTHAFAQTLVGERLAALTDAQLVNALDVMEQLSDDP